VDRLVARTVEAFGRVDIVVNNAADMVGGDFEALIESMLGKDPVDPIAEAPAAKRPLDDWLQQFAINVHGPYLLMTLAAPHLRAHGGGVVINITSEAAELVPLKEALDHPNSNPSLGYHVTKAALNRLTNSMAAKLAADNIAVIAVDPGVIRTEVVELLSAGGLGELPGVPPTVPAALVIDLLATADPMDYSGQVVRAQP
jgi:NAD(P)-dependent dehydrogenase (short-subunit alcohol dehydrogenase family)